MIYPDCSNLIYLILTTEVDNENAYRIANLLLNKKLIPCVSFRNIESHFWWGGEINKSQEVQLILKCKEENLNKVCNIISEIHSYELPEIIYFPVSTNADYYKWVNSF
tara:strand:+ start:1478 stop:1801 length:324 start_codon:yes stop_codon:yes gene_type:complete